MQKPSQKGKFVHNLAIGALVLNGVALTARAEIVENQKQNAFSEIQHLEYAIRWMPEFDAYSAPNRVNGVRFKFGDNGFSVEPRTPSDTDSWSVNFTLVSKGRSASQVRTAMIDTNLNMLEVTKEDGVKLQYINHSHPTGN